MKHPLFLVSVLLVSSTVYASELKTVTEKNTSEQVTESVSKEKKYGPADVTKAPPQDSSHTALIAQNAKLKKIKAQWEAREVTVRKILDKEPENAKALAQLAGLLLAQNKIKEAIPAYQEAITQDSQNPKLFAALSIAYLHYQKFKMATAMANQALKLNPDLKNVAKINEYIKAKQKVLEEASKVNINEKRDAAAAAHNRTIRPASDQLIKNNE